MIKNKIEFNRDKKRRIKQVKYNLNQNEELNRTGKRKTELYTACKKDGKKALADIRAREFTHYKE